MARFSIDGRHVLCVGWPLEEVPDAALAEMLDVPRDQVGARRAALAAQLGDPAWVASTLDALPAATLAILQLLAESGKIALDADLQRDAQARYGIAPERYRHAVLPAFRAALAVPLASRDARSAIGLLQPAAALVSSLVEDLDVLSRPAEAFTPRDGALGDARLFLALCVAAIHMDLKLTMDGQLHRGTVKRLAKQAGVDELLADRMLSFALHLRFLVRDGEFARPKLDALLAAARAEYPASTGLPALQALLASGPVDRDTLLRWSQRHRRIEVEQLLWHACLSYLPGFSEGLADGSSALAFRAPTGSASGHVTPSFEVILPPECHLIDIVQIGACCEWVRLDRAIVARITRPSVMRALGAGTSAEQILGWLTAVSRNPLPQNVEVAVRDWMGTAATAALATGHVVVIDPAAEPRALAALGKLVARKLAPGVLAVDGQHALREVERALVLGGVFIRPEVPARPSKRSGNAAVPPSGGATQPAPANATQPAPANATQPAPSSAGGARLHAKVVAWRRGEPFEGVRDDYLDKAAPLHAPAAEPAPPRTPARKTARTPARATAATTGSPAQLARARLVEWGARNGIDGFDTWVDDEVAQIFAHLPSGALELLLAHAKDPHALLREVQRFLDPPGSGEPPTPRSSAPHGVERSPSARRSPRARPVVWRRDDLRSQLEAAGKRGEWLALDVHGEVRCVAVERVTRRGTAWMVLGEDLVADVAVALPLDAISAIAVLPEDFEPTEVVERDAHDGKDVGRPWRPAPGQAIPAGHVPCPCGSGMRYRNCCRSAAQA